MNKTVIIFVLIVLLGFIGLYMATLPKQNTQSTILDTPTPAQAQQNQQQASPTQTVVSPIPSQDFVSANTGVIKTVKGDIEIVFYPKDAPKTVTNFATLAKRGYYNGLVFHRVLDWVIQGGDPTGTGSGGSSIYGSTFEDELNPEAPSYKAGYVEGILAMANSGPNTNGSQFFILTKDTPLDHAYSIFGKVTKGMDVVKKIAVGDKITSIEVQ